jgi:hypothetical protein
MAKGQQRSNREPKKPKKDRPKIAAAAPGSFCLTVDKAQMRDGLRKKK